MKSGAKDEETLPPAVIGAVSAALRGPELSPERKGAVWSRILAQIGAASPEGTRTLRAEDGQWIPYLPKVELKVLHVDTAANTQTALWRLHPGAVLPAHDHAIDEECLVLEGELRSGDFVVRAGDFHIAFAGRHHDALHADQGALLLICSQRFYIPASPPP